MQSLMALARTAANSGDYFEPRALEGDEWAAHWAREIDELLADIAAEHRFRGELARAMATVGMVTGRG